MKDHIVIGKHETTGLYHGLLYRNHPTPSGMPRPILALSTTEGKTTEKEALEYILSGLKPEYIETLDIPKVSEI